MISKPVVTSRIVKPVVKSIFGNNGMSPIDISGCVLALAPFRIDGFSSGLPFLLARNSGDGIEYPIFGVNESGYWRSEPGGIWKAPANLYPVELVSQHGEPDLIVNGNFTNGTTSWTFDPGISLTIISGNLRITRLTTSTNIRGLYNDPGSTVLANEPIGFLCVIEISENPYNWYMTFLATSPWHSVFSTKIVSQGLNYFFLPAKTDETIISPGIGGGGATQNANEYIDIKSIKIYKIRTYQSTAAYQTILEWPSPSGLPYLSNDGTDDRMKVAHIADIDIAAADSVTIFMRVKPATSGTSCFFLDKYTSNNGYRLLRDGSTGKIQFLSYSGGASKTTQTDNAYADQWFNVAVVVDRATATQRLYVANEMIETDISGHGTFENTNDLLIGSNTAQTTFAPVGIKAGPFFYNAALTESQVKQLFAWAEGL